MLFGGNSGSCGGCGCKSCQECTRTCTNPHTGTAFETVYTLYALGAEAGNPSDGYLDATGDVDTSDPYDGMDGTGPWSQTVSGTFTLMKTTTRYPCYVVASFWRSNFVLGPNTNPPPSADLTSQTITVTNLGPGVLVSGEYEFMRELQPGESYTYEEGIPLVAGSGDQSTNDPRITTGRIAWRQKCVNETVSFTVTAGINWNVQKRQHVLYGTVRECYREAGYCDTYCSDDPTTPPAETVYLAFSGLSYTRPAGVTQSAIDLLEQTFSQTYAIDQDGSQGACNSWPSFVWVYNDYLTWRVVGVSTFSGVRNWLVRVFHPGVPFWDARYEALVNPACISSGVSLSGTADIRQGGDYSVGPVIGSVNWTLTT